MKRTKRYEPVIKMAHDWNGTPQQAEVLKSGGYIQPSRGDVHINQPLTALSIAFMQSAADFVADRVFPNIPVTKQSDAYYIFDRADFNRDEAQERAPGTESAGGSYGVSDETYYARVYSIHKDIPDQIRANADSVFSLDSEAAQYVTHKGLIRREKAFVDTFFKTGVWGTERAGVASSATGTQFIRWDESASDPILDIREGKTTVKEKTGFMPNVLTVSRSVYDSLIDNEDIVARLDRGQTDGPAMVTRDALAALFELDEVLIMDSVENTAAKGLAEASRFIGGKHALLSYRPNTPGLLTPSAGYTFSWTGLLGSTTAGMRIRTFRMDHLDSDRVEMDQAFAHKRVAAELGYFFLDAVS